MAQLNFRDYIPNENTHPRLGDVNFQEYTVSSWAEFGLRSPLVRDLWARWQKLYAEPFCGITTNGKLEEGLFEIRAEASPVSEMTQAANSFIGEATAAGTVQSLRYDIDATEWRCWMNPEFYFAKKGLRVEEQPVSVRSAALGLVEASLSKQGYSKVRASMHINRFLGDLVNASHLMNQDSYNIIIFGEPSLKQPWGWSLWGHHLSLCVFVLGTQMVISPVFFGCEPNRIDAGPHAGTEVFVEEMRMATRIMQSLTPAERETTIAYHNLDDPGMPEGFPHPADGRILTGAYEDNKIVPYSGAAVSSFGIETQYLVLELIKKFIDFLPDGPLNAKMQDVRKHLDETWLMWMGGYDEQAVFHFRIHSPIIICEFDHECGMYLTNAEPGRFHVHSVVRTPNGNDYGKALLEKWRAEPSSIANGI